MSEHLSSEPTAEGLTETEDYGDLTARWRDASSAARKSEHHWPADCLAEAAEVVTRLADRLAAVQAEVEQAREIAAERVNGIVRARAEVAAAVARAESVEAERDAALAALDRVKAVLRDLLPPLRTDARGGWRPHLPLPSLRQRMPDAHRRPHRLADRSPRRCRRWPVVSAPIDWDSPTWGQPGHNVHEAAWAADGTHDDNAQDD